ncbi:P-loop containing nucleoside triphosphate hydrolases superfamily protein [Thalictrum thalictroides]|uniref:Signal recognition particle receptor subunit beta n=1 Tax=Thalictrum thalictroides TaxID=46969 RepID=A0A7J6WU67_THATH|nr:P-loop containing nucleoside triphosphate hydrolases superfamily protein [Thalictrum thalictroides]
MERGMEEWLKQADQLIREVPPVQLYVAIGVLLLTSVLFLLVRILKRTKSNTIVFAGLSVSGKTVLFYQLRDGSSHQGTVTSMDPNEDSFVLHSESDKVGKVNPVHVIDVPGHSRLRTKLDEYLPQAAGLKIPVLILCNKTDKVTAHTKEFIRKQLEKEIDKLRTSRTAISEADIANEFTLGVVDVPFSFTQCHNKVNVAESSGLTGEISQLEQFIRDYVRS